MTIKGIICSLLVFMPLTDFAQVKDKAEADSLVYQELTARYMPENWHPKLMFQGSQIEETAEQGICIVRGDFFQVKSLRTDFYVCKQGNNWSILNDSRFPYETMTNLLLNRIDPNAHQLKITHHQYGGKRPVVMMPMQKLYDVFARHMQLYASVTKISDKEIRGVLVFHQKRLDYIHMLEIRVSTAQLFTPNSTLTGDLYTNIPQHNIKSIFKDKDQTKQ